MIIDFFIYLFYLKALFRQHLKPVTIMEGLDIILECKSEKEDCLVQWFKNGEEIFVSADGRKQEKSQGRSHTLNIYETSLEDSGQYSIRIKGYSSETKGCTSYAKVDVKGNTIC